jgi:hypothetical protein
MKIDNFLAELKRRNVYNSPIGESYVLNRNRLVKSRVLEIVTDACRPSIPQT